jgi:hypothetical protein
MDNASGVCDFAHRPGVALSKLQMGRIKVARPCKAKMSI